MEYINLNAQYRLLKPQIDANIQRVLDSSSFILGDFVEEFEQKLAQYVGVKHVVACSDGTAALQLIYMANDIGRGDAVFCPAMTFIASIEPACMLGATPVFCEIDEYYNISPESLERQIGRVLSEGKYTPKAIVAVDFLGNPANFDDLEKIAEKYGLLLIEDAAQSMGARYHGKKCGSLGDIAATSFFPSKPLGCYGDGGAVFTNDDDIYRLLLSLRVHGKGKSKYDNVRIGLNSRLDSVQAAILLPKLAVLDEEIERRQQIAAQYDGAFADRFAIPKVESDSVCSYAQYVLNCKSEKEREDLQQRLKTADIPTLRYYPNPLHLLPVFNGINTYGENLEKAEQYAKCSFGIPFSPYLDKDEISCVIRNILD